MVRYVFIEVFKLRKMVHLSRYYDVVVKYLLKAIALCSLDLVLEDRSFRLNERARVPKTNLELPEDI